MQDSGFVVEKHVADASYWKLNIWWQVNMTPLLAIFDVHILYWNGLFKAVPHTLRSWAFARAFAIRIWSLIWDNLTQKTVTHENNNCLIFCISLCQCKSFINCYIELQCFVKFKQRVVNSYAVVCVFQVCIIVKFNTPYSQHSCRVALHPLPYPPPYTIQLQSRLDNSQ